MNFFAGMMRYISRGQTLADVSLKDLRQQMRDYDIEERKLGQDLKAFENEQQKMLAEYKHARDNNNRSQIDFIARKFEEKKGHRQSLDSRHVTLIKYRRLTQNLLLLKENEEWVKKLTGRKWLNMSVEDLQEAMQEMLAKQDGDNATLDELLDSMASHQEADAMQQSDTSSTIAELDQLVDGAGFKDQINEEISSIDRALEETRKSSQVDQSKSRDELQ